VSTLPTQRLKVNSIGPWGLAALAIGITSPAMGLYALWGPMQLAAGPITPLIFLASMVLTLPTAISYALLNYRLPSAGSASTWLWECLDPTAGLLAGYLMTTYFLMAAVAQPLMFALFFRDFLLWLHVSLPNLETLMLGIVVSTVPIAWTCLRGAESSVKATVRLMLIETFVVVILSVTIVMSRHPGSITLAPLDPHNATHGLSGFWTAMILGVLAFCGFDVVSTAAEEAHAPRQHVPKAILLTIVGMAVFWAVNAWAFTLSTPPDQVEKYTEQGLTAVTPIAEHYWGLGSLIVILTAFTGLTAVYISSVQGTSRIVFALARHGLLPEKLAHLSGEKRVPRNAVLTVLFIVIALDASTVLILKSGLDSFTWWANALVFFATLTFLAVNAANFLYFFRFLRGEFSTFLNFVVPLLGVILNSYLIYAAFFSVLWSSDLPSGRSVVHACITLFGAQVAVVLWVRFRRPALLSREPPLGADPG
jgi:amino acid transporter